MSRPAVRYVSDYLVDVVDLPDGSRFHQFWMTWDRHRPEAEGSCDLDPNICGLDAFGDPAFCTLIAIGTRDMTLSLLDQKPGHRAYTMKWRAERSRDYQEVPLRVVTIIARGQEPRVRLLVLKPDRSIERIIALHEAPTT